ncbi:hypothetical protein H5410_015364 [Solanum commersonii]|uniref:Uncharacterized protein n=1 Tax=Solanum commersonii TaxID=4109 RepID=A0A9J5ZU70_SOLCO|nr:hypothetical protein H5410_015364 [Solanum commersonii]
MWAMEHFHQRKNMDDICFSNANHIESFYDRMRRFVSPVGTDDWYGYLASRTVTKFDGNIHYSHIPAYIRCRRFYYIKLIGLKGLQPYAPVRMLQRFSQAQEGRLARMSGKSVNARIPPIALVSNEETKESMFRKIIETKERIPAAKRRLAILDQTEWMLRERIIEVDMKTASVKTKIAKLIKR